MKKILIYLLLIGIFASLSWYMIEKGNHIVRQNQETSTRQSVIQNDSSKPVVIVSASVTTDTTYRYKMNPPNRS